MRMHSLDVALPRSDGSHFDARGAGHPLISDGFQEFPHPNSARITRGTACGENVIRADALVAVCDGRLLTDEQRTVIAKSLEIVIGVGDVQLQMLWRIIVGKAN